MRRRLALPTFHGMMGESGAAERRAPQASIRRRALFRNSMAPAGVRGRRGMAERERSQRTRSELARTQSAKSDGSKPDPESKSDSATFEPISLIMVQFLGWVAERPRTYPETMEAWHSTCPRLSVWEDAVIDRLVRIDDGAGRAVVLTDKGRAVLAAAKVNA
jgi:hypothetical protein